MHYQVILAVERRRSVGCEDPKGDPARTKGKGIGIGEIGVNQ